MPKLTVVLGKRTHLLLEDSTVKLGTARTVYPEIGRSPDGNPYLIHADNFVKKTIDEIEGWLKDGLDVELWTNHETLVGLIGGRVYQQEILQDNLVKLYNDDNSAFDSYCFDNRGVLTSMVDGRHWPFGWFLCHND
jgi:hypothetical protein